MPLLFYSITHSSTVTHVFGATSRPPLRRSGFWETCWHLQSTKIQVHGFCHPWQVRSNLKLYAGSQSYSIFPPIPVDSWSVEEIWRIWCVSSRRARQKLDGTYAPRVCTGLKQNDYAFTARRRLTPGCR